jgi:hypothetical protein
VPKDFLPLIEDEVRDVRAARLPAETRRFAAYRPVLQDLELFIKLIEEETSQSDFFDPRSNRRTTAGLRAEYAELWEAES